MMTHTQNIQVFVRCRPLAIGEKQSPIEVLSERREVKVHDRNSGNSHYYEARAFQFDQVFSPDSGQADVYIAVVKPLINQVLLGFNCTVFAYGQTGTGKTYTMEGDRFDENLNWEDDPYCGIIPRSISQMIDSLRKPNRQFVLRVSFLELYNEDAYDLLGPLEEPTKLKIFDDVHRKGSVIVDGLSETIVNCKEEIFDILKRGTLKRQKAATLLNACSSRSHTIFNITVETKECSPSGVQLVKTGKLNLVDLAGSESIGRSGAQDKRAREAGNINQSLLTLGRVIAALVEKRPHIPYRESKLTRILQDSLGGATRTSMIATISPAETDLANTISTLDYAARARNIVNKPESNQQLTQRKTNDEINEEILARHNSELIELEFRVRNEVAVEFKRESEKMKQTYKEHYERQIESLEATYEERLKESYERLDRLASQLQEMSEVKDNLELRIKETSEERERLQLKLAESQAKVMAESQDIDQVKRDLKLANELAEYRAKLLSELESNLKSKELEIKNYREENKNLKLENEELREKLSESPDKVDKKATKIRKAPVLEESGDYANLTFDGGDEILGQKSRKKIVAGSRKRAINQTIVLSGKKKKLKNNAEAELSPLTSQETTRVTRSRATRRKLDY